MGAVNAELRILNLVNNWTQSCISKDVDTENEASWLSEPRVLEKVQFLDTNSWHIEEHSMLWGF